MNVIRCTLAKSLTSAASVGRRLPLEAITILIFEPISPGDNTLLLQIRRKQEIVHCGSILSPNNNLFLSGSLSTPKSDVPFQPKPVTIVLQSSQLVPPPICDNLQLSFQTNCDTAAIFHWSLCKALNQLYHFKPLSSLLESLCLQ